MGKDSCIAEAIAIGAECQQGPTFNACFLYTAKRNPALNAGFSLYKKTPDSFKSEVFDFIIRFYSSALKAVKLTLPFLLHRTVLQHCPTQR